MYICNSNFSYFAARSKVRDKLLRSTDSSAFEFQAFRNSPGALAGSDVCRPYIRLELFPVRLWPVLKTLTQIISSNGNRSTSG
jgi:hypothetical protein